ncbi:MAG: ABC transporter substrate-binding protein, partial [Anoxybacillus ayderensis]|nr:ABC transporter substrate-binding protein [Anoxybacillus ayderensis]
MKKKGALLATLLLGASMLFGCSGGDKTATEPEKEGGKEQGTIKIGALFDITGATGDVGTPYAEGEKAYIEYIISKFGVNGYNIELVGQDYAYKIPEAQKLYQKYKASDKVSAILGWGTADTEA